MVSLPLMFMWKHCCFIFLLHSKRVTSKVSHSATPSILPRLTMYVSFTLSQLKQVTLHINHFTSDDFLCPANNTIHGLNPFPL